MQYEGSHVQGGTRKETIRKLLVIERIYCNDYRQQENSAHTFKINI